MLQATHRAAGRAGASSKTRPPEVLGEDRVDRPRFEDGATLDCDMVVISAGIRPNVGAGAATAA